MLNKDHKTLVTVQTTIIKAIDETNNELQSFHINGKLNIIDSKKIVEDCGFVYINKTNFKNSFYVNTSELTRMALKPVESDYKTVEEFNDAKEHWIFINTPKHHNFVNH